jgi:hypothetical protein
MGLMLDGFVGTLVSMEASWLGFIKNSKIGEWVSWEQLVNSAGNIGTSMA